MYWYPSNCQVVWFFVSLLDRIGSVRIQAPRVWLCVLSMLLFFMDKWSYVVCCLCAEHSRLEHHIGSVVSFSVQIGSMDVSVWSENMFHWTIDGDVRWLLVGDLILACLVGRYASWLAALWSRLLSMLQVLCVYFHSIVVLLLSLRGLPVRYLLCLRVRVSSGWMSLSRRCSTCGGSRGFSGLLPCIYGVWRRNLAAIHFSMDINRVSAFWCKERTAKCRVWKRSSFKKLSERIWGQTDSISVRWTGTSRTKVHHYVFGSDDRCESASYFWFIFSILQKSGKPIQPLP